MIEFGSAMVIAGFAICAMSGLGGFAVLSAMIVEIIPFGGPPRFMMYGLFGGIWLAILGGILLAIGHFIEWKF